MTDDVPVMIINASRTCSRCGWTVPAVITGFVGPCPQCELAAALEPFVTHNTSEPTITITVRSAHITRARAALALWHELALAEGIDPL